MKFHPSTICFALSDTVVLSLSSVLQTTFFFGVCSMTATMYHVIKLILHQTIPTFNDVQDRKLLKPVFSPFALMFSSLRKTPS